MNHLAKGKTNIIQNIKKTNGSRSVAVDNSGNICGVDHSGRLGVEKNNREHKRNHDSVNGNGGKPCLNPFLFSMDSRDGDDEDDDEEVGDDDSADSNDHPKENSENASSDNENANVSGKHSEGEDLDNYEDDDDNDDDDDDYDFLASKRHSRANHVKITTKKKTQPKKKQKKIHRNTWRLKADLSILQNSRNGPRCVSPVSDGDDATNTNAAKNHGIANEPHDSHNFRKKYNSEEYLAFVREARRFLIEKKVKYESEYYTKKLDPSDTELYKLYCLTVDKFKHKVLSVYIGCNNNSVYSRANEHNKVGITHINNRTKGNASNWQIFMILYVPKMLRSHVSTKILWKFWDSGHGAAKIARGFFLQKYFGLNYALNKNISKTVSNTYVQKMNTMFVEEYDEYNFKPQGIDNVNAELFFDPEQPYI